MLQKIASGVSSAASAPYVPFQQLQIPAHPSHDMKVASRTLLYSKFHPVDILNVFQKNSPVWKSGLASFFRVEPFCAASGHSKFSDRSFTMVS